MSAPRKFDQDKICASISCLALGLAKFVSPIIGAILAITGCLYMFDGCLKYLDHSQATTFLLMKIRHSNPESSNASHEVAGAKEDAANHNVTTDHDTTTDHDGYGILEILHGFEILLLCPLPYLILHTMTKVIHDWGHRATMSLETAHKIDLTKIHLFGIFIGVLTLDFIGKSMGSKLQPLSGLVQLAGIIVLIVFYFKIKHVSHAVEDELRLKEAEYLKDALAAAKEEADKLKREEEELANEEKLAKAGEAEAAAKAIGHASH